MEICVSFILKWNRRMVPVFFSSINRYTYKHSQARTPNVIINKRGIFLLLGVFLLLIVDAWPMFITPNIVDCCFETNTVLPSWSFMIIVSRCPLSCLPFSFTLFITSYEFYVVLHCHNVMCACADLFIILIRSIWLEFFLVKIRFEWERKRNYHDEWAFGVLRPMTNHRCCFPRAQPLEIVNLRMRNDFCLIEFF